MRRLLFLSMILMLLMAGCAVICPQQKQVLLQDQVEFSRAFDHFQLTGNTKQLQLFRNAYPESLWAERAGAVVRYAQQLGQQKQQMRQQKQQFEALRVSEKVLSADMEKLKEENRQLSEKLEQLKGLLIQLEAQSK